MRHSRGAFAETIANRGTWYAAAVAARGAGRDVAPPLPTGGNGLEVAWFGCGIPVGEAGSEAMGGLLAVAVSWAGRATPISWLIPNAG